MKKHAFEQYQWGHLTYLGEVVSETPKTLVLHRETHGTHRRGITAQMYVIETDDPMGVVDRFYRTVKPLADAIIAEEAALSERKKAAKETGLRAAGLIQGQQQEKET